MKKTPPGSLVDETTEEGREAGAKVLEIVENQIRDATPPAVAATLARLQATGHTREEALRYIACALSIELFEILQQQGRYDETRYLRNLDALPTLPYDEDEI